MSQGSSAENSPKKRFAALNPLQKIEGEVQARAAAKNGALVSGYLILSYLIQLAFLYFTGRDISGDEGTALLVIDVIAIVLAALLTWRILVSQPLWAAIVVSVWFIAELVLKIAAIGNGEQTTNFGWVIMFLALIVGSILAIRGSWKLRALRRA